MRITLFAILTILFVNTARSQVAGSTHRLSEVGWTITLPAEFVILDSAENQAKMERGLKAIEDASDVTADLAATKTLISATKETFNDFSVTVTRFDPAVDGSYAENNKAVKDITYLTLVDQVPGAKIDTATTSYTIDNLVFDKFSINVTIPGTLSMSMSLLSKYYKGFDFGISYVCMDDKTKKQIEDMLQSSKFEK